MIQSISIVSLYCVVSFLSKTQGRRHNFKSLLAVFLKFFFYFHNHNFSHLTVLHRQFNLTHRVNPFNSKYIALLNCMLLDFLLINLTAFWQSNRPSLLCTVKAYSQGSPSCPDPTEHGNHTRKQLTFPV